MGGPSGTTDRLRAWLCSLATCINGGALTPFVVVAVFRVLDGPGTPIHPDLDSIPITRSIFGGAGLMMNTLVTAHLSCAGGMSGLAPEYHLTHTLSGNAWEQS